MPDDLDTPALRRFARDLSRIREDRGVSRAAIQEETQVHASHLKSFEEGVLHEEERMNGVYLKAFVRAYAEAIGLSTETVVDHLESALSGTYDDQLAAAFVSVPPAEDEPDDPETSAPKSSAEEEQEAAPSPGPVDEPEDASEAAGGVSQGAASEPTQAPPQDESPAAHPQAPNSSGASASSTDSDRSSGDSQEGKHFSDLTEEEEAKTRRNQSSMSEPPPARRASRTDSFSGDVQEFFADHRGKVLLAVGVALVLALVGGLGIYLTGEDATSEASSEGETLEASPAAEAGPSGTEAAGDTSTSPPQPPRQPPADITLGDTLHVTVRATADVRELRVQQDDNLRRPYWIEAGEARVFPFAERVTLQNQLDSLEVLLEGYRYPITSTDEQGRVIIRRDTAEQFADTLRGPPLSIPESPDTIRGQDSFPDPDTTSSGRAGAES
ncbi:helix-turn-helix domain-containing protein [Salinibacter grassmerensis]|uniref:helix-turn-helix domain-containing protein n=1 Tax=Salinibacter grassmerensis TaxID=3040353 RepID=UPI0021E81D0B|nr:helix-turn-helix domain-containing protein [Salinibacter grassmerensis]